MIYTPQDYCSQFTFRGKKVSPRTIRRRCRDGMLPSGHIAIKKTFGWVIEVKEKTENK